MSLTRGSESRLKKSKPSSNPSFPGRELPSVHEKADSLAKKSCSFWRAHRPLLSAFGLLSYAATLGRFERPPWVDLHLRALPLADPENGSSGHPPRPLKRSLLSGPPWKQVRLPAYHRKRRVSFSTVKSLAKPAERQAAS